jgi:uncharacterized transporter YbjL
MSVFMGATTKPFQFVEVVGFSALGLAGLGVIAGLVARSWALALGGFAVGLWAFSLVITGMVGEYLVRMNYEVGRKPKYLVRKIHE